jgi:hypothetical protein
MPRDCSSSPELKVLVRPTGTRPRQLVGAQPGPPGYDSPSAGALRGHQRLYFNNWPEAEIVMANDQWEVAEKKLREIVENTAYVAKKFTGKFTVEQLRALGRERVQVELQVLNCRWKQGKFGNWVVTLQRLETDPYLGKKERVRLDVFKGKL